MGFLVLGAGGWEKLGAIAAVIAAVAGVAGLIVTWVLGRSSQREARLALEHDRLAEARRLVREVLVFGDNGAWARCAEMQAQLRSVLRLLRSDLPECWAVAETPWNDESYGGDEDNLGLPARAARAREELEQASRSV